MILGPSIAIGLGIGALIARMTRTTVLETLREDYVRTARAKGLGQNTLLIRHVLRNAMLPVITVTGLSLAGLLGGSVAVERAFGFPGLGSALAQASVERDWMMVQNLTLLFAVIFVFINLFIDLLYAWIDPRIRYS
jgi:ABC-type dipeptide/oligopeptide/nickel transport system permease component